MQSMERYTFPVIGDMSVDRIDRGDVLSILTPIWPTRPETAARFTRLPRKSLHSAASRISESDTRNLSK